MFFSPTHPFLLRKILIVCLLIVSGLLFLAYVGFQARHLIEGPRIYLSEEPPRQTEGATVVLRGSVQNITTLFLNGKQIYTDDTGNFSETLVLPHGYTIITITAHDRYGREESLNRHIVRS